MREGTSRRTSLFAPTRDRALLLAWLLALILVAHEVVWTVDLGALWDSATYWSAWRTPTLYTGPPGDTGSYLYSPLFAQILWPLTLLPLPVFEALWLALGASAYVWLVRPIGWAWGVPLLALGLEDLRAANISWLLALVCVVGLRHPAAWAVAMLTKVGSGVGVLWYAGRRDWRSLAIAVGAVATLVGISALASPGLWADWIAFLSDHASPAATVRVAAAAVLAVVAGRTSRAWLLPFALVLAAPLAQLYVLGVLCALPRLLTPDALARARAPFGGVRATLRRALDLPERSRRTPEPHAIRG